ncbi:MAG TPA: PQQ-binding-like beta-propeller repeat protein [Vicinamibacterales bacterium]|nr:PQQ-binding-like beta-propeller repeat protein [Vicinamibacterales bacterium]
MPSKELAVACVIVVATVALYAQGSSRDYVQWRGQQRDGSASAFVEPKQWPETLTRRWKVDVGEGYGTPLIVGDIVYVVTRLDGQEGVTAVDVSTGRQRWRSQYPAPYTPSQPAAAHGASPKATPLYHDGRIFTLGISGMVSAFDANSGKQLWQSAAPNEAPFYGAAVSPLAFRDLVIVHPGDYGALTAFDTRSGAVKWTAGSGGFFASPILVTLEQTPQVVSATQDFVIGVSSDGRILWRFPCDGKNGSTTPVLNNDTIIVNTPDRVIAFRPRLRDGAWIVETMWETKDVSTYLSTPVVVNDVLYGLSTKQRGQFYAIDAKTGQVLWLGTPREADNTAVAKAGQLLFLLNDDAELIVARANRKAFDPLARYVVADSATWAQPTISGDRIFIKDVNTLALWTLRAR